MRGAMVLASLVLLSAMAAANPDTVCLRGVHFADQREGWAVGDSGIILHTIDGGTTWERQMSGTKASLRCVQFLTPYVGYAAGRVELPNRVGSAGLLLTTTDGGTTWRELTSSTLPGLQLVHFFDEQNGVVAGESAALGLGGVFITTNAGQTWKNIDSSMLQPGPWTHFQGGTAERFRLVNQGTAGVHTFDKGQLVRTLEGIAPFTPRPLPKLMSAAHFIDHKTGWCVGALGQIQRTADGGTTWTLQRSGGLRLGLLAISAKSETIPLPVLALHAKEGYHTAAITFQQQDEARLSQALQQVAGFALAMSLPEALQEAYAHEPGSGQFDAPEPTPEQVQLLAKHLRELQPEVIVCDAGHTLAERYVMKLLQAAMVQDAPTGEAMPKIKRIALVHPAGPITLDLLAMHPELGACLKDHCEPALRLFNLSHLPNSLNLKVAFPDADKAVSKSLFEGLGLAEGGSARGKKRETTSTIAAILPQREQVAKVRRELEAHFNEPLTRDRTEQVLVKCLEGLRQVPESSVPRVAVEMGWRFVEAGQWTAARELFAGIAEHHAMHPDAVEAMRWLVKYHASGEVRRRLERGDFPIFQRAAFTPVEASPIQQASAVEELIPRPMLKFLNAESLRQWNQLGLDLQPKLAAFGMAYSQDPETVLPLVSIRRNLGLHARALETTQLLAGTSPMRSRFSAERDLLDPQPNRTPSLPMWTCLPLNQRPLLDGKLDEDFWKTADSVQLAGGPTEYATKAHFRHDGQFLYVALACEHPAGKAVAKAERRTPDANLNGHDRVELSFDLDRDYQTSYRLSVDHRGLVRDECWDDASWNPKWFVAHEPSATGWVCELAIPLSELSDTPGIWNVGLRRVLPGVGEASSQGLLTFKR